MIQIETPKATQEQIEALEAELRGAKERAAPFKALDAQVATKKQEPKEAVADAENTIAESWRSVQELKAELEKLVVHRTDAETSTQRVRRIQTDLERLRGV